MFIFLVIVETSSFPCIKASFGIFNEPFSRLKGLLSLFNLLWRKFFFQFSKHSQTVFLSQRLILIPAFRFFQSSSLRLNTPPVFFLQHEYGFNQLTNE